MRREFESKLASRVTGKKAPSRVWALVAVFAAVLVCGAAAVTAVAAGNGDMLRDQTQDQDKLQDGSCDDGDSDGDGVCDNFVDEDGDGICDLCGTCADCPCAE